MQQKCNMKKIAFKLADESEQLCRKLTTRL